MAEKVVGALKWVKGEIVATLRRVRDLVESCGSSGESAPMDEGAAALREVWGVLTALELALPAHLAKEMQCLAESIRDGQVPSHEGAAEALMLALIQLPSHLDRLDSDVEPPPLSLLPTINDLRASRGAPPLTQAEFLVPGSVLAADLESEPAPEALDSMGGAIRKVRPHFLRHLLEWYRPATSSEGLLNLRRLFHQTYCYLDEGVLADLLRLAEAYGDALETGQVSDEVGARALFGRLDRIFKPLIQTPPEWPRVQVRNLFDDLLNGLPQGAGQPEVIVELQRRYGYPALGDLPEGVGEALAELASSVLTEIGTIKERLDLFVRSGRSERTLLEEIRLGLQELSHSLEVASTGRLPERLQTLADGFRDLGELDAGGDALRLEPLAAELLGIEASLRAFAERRCPPDGTGGGSGLFAGELRSAALRESRGELAGVKRAILSCLEQGQRPVALAPVTAQLANVSGALQVLGDDAGGHLAEDIAALVRRRYLVPDQQVPEEALVLLADAVAALELHVERLDEGSPDSETLVAQARESLTALDLLADEVPGTPVASAVQVQERVETAPACTDAEDGSATGDRPGGIAEEFLEVFLEEAREELASAVEQLDRWRADLGDQESLTILRRSFHTLKGSGRLVGAERVAQLGQAVERLLNRVLDGALKPGADLLALIEDAVVLLPDVVSAEADGRPISVAALVERADRVLAGAGPGAADGEGKALQEATHRAEILPSPSAPPVSGCERSSEDERREGEDSGTVPLGLGAEDPPARTDLQQLLDETPPPADHESQFVADEELLEIFRGETAEHLAALRAFLAQASGGERIPDEAVVRALHTLAGSARMAGIDSIAQVAKPLELCFRSQQERRIPLSEGLLELLTRAVDGIEARIADLPGHGASVGVLLALARSVAQLQDVSAVPASGDGPLGPSTSPETTPQVPNSEAQGPGSTLAHPVKSADEDAFVGPVQEPEPVVEMETAPEPGPATNVAPEPEKATPAPELAATLADTGSESAAAAVPVSIEGQESSAKDGPAKEEACPSPTVAPPLDPGEEFEAQPADSDLKNLFLEDARELLERIDAQIHAWQLAPRDPGVLDALKRNLHTLKGSARLTGITAIGDLSHALETHLTAAGDSGAEVDETTLDLAQKTADILSVQVEALERGAPIPRARGLVEALSGPPESAGNLPATPDLSVTRPPVGNEAVVGTPATGPFAALVREKEAGAPAAAVPQIRVRGDLLNRLVDFSGEIGLYRARLSQRNGLMGFGLGELGQTVTRLREQLRLLEIETETQILHRFEGQGVSQEEGVLFDPLELDRFSSLQQLSRALAETVNDLVSLQELLWGYQRESADLLSQQARLAEELQDGLLRTRMVPFVQVVPRLHRLVRQTADSLGKSARLDVLGPEVELDRSILDRLVAPLEHLLRNAVDHGLEGPDDRARAGKPSIGVITLVLSREGNDVVISLSDDGRGMDVGAIRRQAIARGLLAPQVVLSDEALMQFVFEPGFSTHGRVTQISGRGVGMDVVNSEVKAANGTIAIDSVAGRGTSFTIRLPLTLAVIEAFQISVGEHVYAVPHSTIEGAARIGRDELAALYSGKGESFRYRDHAYRVAYLGAVLDRRRAPQLGERRWIPLLLTRVGDLRVAFHVDSLIESSRVLVKPLGPQLAGVRWLSGGAILPNGRVALILDALALLRSGALQDHLPTATPGDGAVNGPACVMVVDDSLTVRRVTARLLRRQNMEVVTAKDGVEALTLLDERRPDVMLLDIEMPRMDGYELTRHVRRSDRLKDLPIIMITSRTGDKHRDHALALGVDRFLGKPYQESELLDEISSVLSGSHG